MSRSLMWQRLWARFEHLYYGEHLLREALAAALAPETRSMSRARCYGDMAAEQLILALRP